MDDKSVKGSGNKLQKAELLSKKEFNKKYKAQHKDLRGKIEGKQIENRNNILSNGFKQRGTGVSMNASGGTYIYIAFAENPFKYSLAR